MNPFIRKIQKGHGLLPCNRLQRGDGIGSLLRGFIKIAKPIINRGISYLTKQGKSFILSKEVKDLAKKQLAKSGRNILADTIEGKSLKESLTKEIRSASNEKDIRKARKRLAQKIRSNNKEFKKRKIKRKKISMKINKDIFT